MHHLPASIPDKLPHLLRRQRHRSRRNRPQRLLLPNRVLRRRGQLTLLAVHFPVRNLRCQLKRMPDLHGKPAHWNELRVPRRDLRQRLLDRLLDLLVLMRDLRDFLNVLHFMFRVFGKG